MTINTDNRLAGPFNGNGVQTVFPFTFKAFADTDFDGKVVLKDASGVETIQTRTSQYTIALNADQNVSPGGNLTMVTAPPTGTTLTFTTNVPNTQKTNITNTGGFFAQVVTTALDKLTILIQQLAGRVDRSIKIPLSDGTSVTTELPTKTARANSTLGFDANGDLIVGAVSTANVSTAMQPVLAASTLSLARAALGATSVGDSLFTAASASTALTLLGFSAFTQTLAPAANAAAFRSLIGAQAAGSYAASGANGDITSMTALASMNGGQLAGFRNFIINGGFDVWQRGTTYSLATSAVVGSADRWAVQGGAAAGIFNRDTSVSAGSGFTYNAKMGRNNGSSSTTQILALQALETINSVPLAGKTVTLSFLAKRGANFSGASNNLNVTLYVGTGADQSAQNAINGSWTGQSLVISSTAALTTSFQQFTYTATVPSNTTQLAVQLGYTPSGTAGADDNVYFTGVQLEIGSVATPFENIGFDNTLKRCERYYEKGFDYATAPADGSASFWNGGSNGVLAYVANNLRTPAVQFRTKKRATPTITLYRPGTTATAGALAFYNGSWTAMTGASISTNQDTFTVYSTATSTANQVYMFDGGWAASAEL